MGMAGGGVAESEDNPSSSDPQILNQQLKDAKNEKGKVNSKYDQVRRT